VTVGCFVAEFAIAYWTNCELQVFVRLWNARA
jgi:hypothetical protein